MELKDLRIKSTDFEVQERTNIVYEAMKALIQKNFHYSISPTMRMEIEMKAMQRMLCDLQLRLEKVENLIRQWEPQ